MINLEELYSDLIEKIASQNGRDRQNDLDEVESYIDRQTKYSNSQEKIEYYDYIINGAMKLYKIDYYTLGNSLLHQGFLIDLLKNKRKLLVGQETQKTQQHHFNSGRGDKNLTTIFNRLKDNGYIHTDTTLNTWLYICRGKGEEELPTKLTIQWTSDVASLAILINTLFAKSDFRGMWKITIMCFCIKGEKPNIKSMKSMISKIINYEIDEPKSVQTLKPLLKI